MIDSSYNLAYEVDVRANKDETDNVNASELQDDSSIARTDNLQFKVALNSVGGDSR